MSYELQIFSHGKRFSLLLSAGSYLLLAKKLIGAKNPHKRLQMMWQLISVGGALYVHRQLAES